MHLLKQSLKAHADESPLCFSDEDGIELGSFKDLIHRQEVNRPLIFGFRCGPLQHLRDMRSSPSHPRSQRQDQVSADSHWAELELSFALGPDDRVQLSEVDLTAQWMEGNETDHNVILVASHLATDLSRLIANDEWYFTSDCLSSPVDGTPYDLWTGIDLTTR